MIKHIVGFRPFVKPLIRGFSLCRALGFDCETYIRSDGTAEVNTLQFAGEDFPPEILYVNNQTSLASFMAVVDSWALKEWINVVWSHNASYDLTALLLQFPKWIDRIADGYLKIVWPGAIMEIFSGKTWFAKIKFGQHRRVWILDTMHFTFCSLEASARLFNLDITKEVKPEGLGERRFEKDTVFEKYALTDAIIAWKLGATIQNLHEEFDVPICVSAAQLSGRVFRKHFLRTEFAAPNKQVEEAALASFHGGVSLAVSGFYPALNEYDICSAYPQAMSALGVPLEYRYVKSFGPLNAIYYVRGCVTDTKHPALWTPEFKPFTSPGYSYVTGYELSEAYAHGEFKGRVLDGVEVLFNSDTALTDFVSHFFAEKQKAKSAGDSVRAHFYKRILNSLYGKMIQTVETRPEEPEFGFRAGGLWSPFLASLITGFVRARLHHLEHLSDSVHSATDAVKTDQTLLTSDGLGGLALECSGPCVIVRSKLYAHFDELSKFWKFASHGLGVWPPARAWRQLLATGGTRKRRVVSPKTGRIRKLPVLSWIDVETRERYPIPAMPSNFYQKLLDFLTEM